MIRYTVSYSIQTAGPDQGLTKFALFHKQLDLHCCYWGYFSWSWSSSGTWLTSGVKNISCSSIELSISTLNSLSKMGPWCTLCTFFERGGKCVCTLLVVCSESTICFQVGFPAIASRSCTCQSEERVLVIESSLTWLVSLFYLVKYSGYVSHRLLCSFPLYMLLSLGYYCWFSHCKWSGYIQLHLLRC